MALLFPFMLLHSVLLSFQNDFCVKILITTLSINTETLVNWQVQYWWMVEGEEIFTNRIIISPWISTCDSALSNNLSSHRDLKLKYIYIYIIYTHSLAFEAAGVKHPVEPRRSSNSHSSSKLSFQVLGLQVWATMHGTTSFNN